LSQDYLWFETPEWYTIIDGIAVRVSEIDGKENEKAKSKEGRK